MAMRNYLFLITFFLSPLFAHAEYIESFRTTMDLANDASFTVTETIDYVFTEDKHGIIREIPLLHPEPPSASWKERIIAIELDEVSMNNAPVPYVLESTSDKFILRIGDADKTITGRHTYTFTYRVEGGLSYPKGKGTELYWNVTGNEWPVPIRAVETTITSPDGLFRSERSCYLGTTGESSRSCATKVEDDGRVTFRTTELYPGEGMTVAQALDAARVPKEIRERTRVLLFIIPLLILGLLYVSYRFYRYKTAHKTDVPIIAQYEPYPGVKPMYTGLLMDGRLDPRDITACIVYLAEQGYLKIRKTEKKVLFLFTVDDYEITLIRTLDERVSTFEKSILVILLDAPLTVGKIVSLSELKSDVIEQRRNHKEILALEKELDDDLVRTGFFEHGFMRLIMRRTRKGYEALNHLEGFKLFLETTERDRYLFHNAPEKSPEQFMEFLPYAIAFGVEDKWAKVFEGITIPNPGWYDSGSVGSFSAMNLTQSLGAFGTAFASSSGASASSGGGSSGGGAGGGGGGSW
jgi:Predicted membrane protein (DUF2207)